MVPERVTAADGVVVDVHRTGPAEGPAVIVCHGFVQNRLSFESRSRSLLTHFAGLGYAVYVVELRGRDRKARRAHGLHEYVNLDAPAVVDAVSARHRSVSWLGHSMGGLVGTLLPESARDKLDAVATVGAPLFAGPPRLRRLFDVERTIRAARFAHGRGLAFQGQLWSGALYRLRKALDRAFVPAPIRIWAPGSLDEDALAFTLKQSFTDDSYAVLADLLDLVVTDGARAGDLDAGMRLARFDRPLLVIAGDADDLAPPDGARPVFERAGSAQKEYVEVKGAGHIDLLIGDRAPEQVWGPLARFFGRSRTL